MNTHRDDRARYPMAHRSWWAAALAVALVSLLLVPTSPASAATSASSSTAATPGPAASPTFSIGSPHDLSPLFWGTTVAPWARLLPTEGDEVQSAGVSVVVWPGAFAGDELNPLANDGTGVLWSNGNQEKNGPTNEAQFVAWCRSINCTAIFQVPGEIDNATIAAAIVDYTVNVTYTGPMWNDGAWTQVTMPGLDFRPAYWEIGNEPALWDFWGEPWGSWNRYSSASSTEYADEEHQYIQAMNAANSSYTPRIIGLPGIGRADSLDSPSQWVSAVISENGPNLSAIADHIYPARDLPTGGNSLVQFYEQIEGWNPSSLPSRVGDYEGSIEAACTTPGNQCGPDGNSSLPLFVTEVGTSLAHSEFGGYSGTFPGAVGMTMEMTQALALPNQSAVSLDLYLTVAGTTNSWFYPDGQARPTYTLYTQLFTHLGNEAFPVNVSGDTNVSAAATIDTHASDRRDFLVVNDNITGGVTFGTSFLNTSSYALGSAPAVAFQSGSPVEVWTWNGTTPAYNASVGLTTSDPATPDPVPTYYPNGLPSTWTLPAQGIALFETYNAPAYPVNFTANTNVAGYAPLAHWFISVAGAKVSSAQPSVTLLMLPGRYALQGYPLTQPPSGTDPRARLLPDLPASLEVPAAPTWFNFTYLVQWALNISWNASRGTVTYVDAAGQPAPVSNGGWTWWNDSKPLTLQFQPAPGFSFDRWDGAGPGSYSGYSQTATLAPTGPVEEKADFVTGTEVTYSESGLPAGTSWSVVVRGYEETTTSTQLTFYEIPGTWSQQVVNVSGFQLITSGQGAWWDQQVTVGSSPLTLPVTFTPLHPGAPFYPLTFQEVGLLTGQTWSVSVRGVTVVSVAPAVAIFSEQAGKYAFTAGASGGYVLGSPTFFTLGSGPMTVFVDFVPQNRLIFNETGLPAGVNWSVLVDGVPSAPAAPGWISERLFNGTYTFEVPGVLDYVPTPHIGTVDLNGTGAVVDVAFLRATFAVVFVVTGLPSGTSYQVRLSNTTEATELASYGFQIPNGSYTYDVSAPTGYYPTPSHGNVSVDGLALRIDVTIKPDGFGPDPPYMTLIMSASTTAVVFGLAAVGGYLVTGLVRRRRRPS